MRSSNGFIVLALCACNRVFGIAETKQVDASSYDGTPDGAFACPPIGTAPAFVHDYRQALLQSCGDYSVNTRIVAVCTDPTLGSIIEEGPIDATALSPAIGLQPPSDTVYDGIALGPDGDLAVVHERIVSTQEVSLVVYLRDDTGWNRSTPILTSLMFGLASAPTRGPNSHVLVYDDLVGLHELVQDDSGTWNDVATYSFAQLGATGILYFSRLTLSPDGLRLVASVGISGASLYYGDRASLNDPFQNLQPLSTVLTDVFMTEDCGRIYFPTLGSVWFADQAPFTSP